jgi:hypothetical protein
VVVAVDLPVVDLAVQPLVVPAAPTPIIKGEHSSVTDGVVVPLAVLEVPRLEGSLDGP